MNRWGILAVLFFARTAMGFQFQSIAAVSPVLIEQLALDLAALGLLIGAWMLPGVAVAIPGGLLGQRFGDKRMALAGLGLMVAGTFVTAFAEDYAAAMAGRVVSGAGAVVLNVLLAKMVADWFEGNRLQTAMGLLVFSWPLGIGLALAILGPLAGEASWAVAIQVAAWACLAALALVAAFYRSPPHTVKTHANRWHLASRDLALALIAGALWTFYNVAYILVVSFAPVLFAARGLAVGSAALVSSFATWGLLFSVALGGYLADRTGRAHALMVGGFLAMGAVMPFLLLAPAPAVMLTLFGVFAGLPAGIVAALPVRTLSAQARHLGLGIFFTLYYLGMSTLPAVAGWLGEALALDAAPLLFGAALLVLCVAGAFVFQRIESWPRA